MVHRPGLGRWGLVLSVALSLAAAACGSQAPGSGNSAGAAAKFPTRPITWIIPYAPGGGSDLSVRRLQPTLQKAFGQKINIEYKDAGDGAVGWQQLAASSPDGYTVANVVDPNILVLPSSSSIKPLSFVYAGWSETSPTALTVTSNGKYKTLKDFIAAAKANPGKLSVAGTGTSGQLDLAQITSKLGIKVTYVPVSAGVGSIVPMLQGGHVAAAVFGASHVSEHSSSLRALAISGSAPAPGLPGVPTFQSLGYSGITLGTTWGVMLPPGTPHSIAEIWNKALVKAVRTAKEQQQLKQGALTPLTDNLQQSYARIKKDMTAVQSAEATVGSGTSSSG